MPVVISLLVAILFVVPFVASTTARVEPKDPPVIRKLTPREQGFKQRRR